MRSTGSRNTRPSITAASLLEVSEEVEIATDPDSMVRNNPKHVSRTTQMRTGRDVADGVFTEREICIFKTSRS